MKKEKPYILSIESSGSTCGTALSLGDEILCEYSLYENNRHDKYLAELIRRVIADTEISFDNINAIAVSSGPESFTGLRIGAGIAKGLCFENKTKLIAVPTLTSIAHSVHKTSLHRGYEGIIPVIRSHKDLVYYQKFDLNGTPASEIFHEETVKLNAVNEKKYLFVSSNLNNESLHNLSVEEFIISPRHIAYLAYKMFLENDFKDSSDFVPLYVQEFVPKTSKKKLNI